jgi:2-methylcitrate dehydratase
MDAVAGYFELNWETEGLERVTRTNIKKYNAEIHSQSVLEAVLGLRAREHLAAADVARVEIDVFDVAYRIIGGGEEGDKMVVRTKEEADHSLPYLVAVALLDGQVLPEQYRPERIRGDDVQALLRRVVVRPDQAFSDRFPGEMPCRVKVTCHDGREFLAELADYPGFVTRGRTWEAAREKFEQLAGPCTSTALREQISSAVFRLERLRVTELTSLLAAVERGRAGDSRKETAA